MGTRSIAVVVLLVKENKVFVVMLKKAAYSELLNRSKQVWPCPVILAGHVNV
jgi:hypothetical protein